jgi:hypothetical protein
MSINNPEIQFPHKYRNLYFLSEFNEEIIFPLCFMNSLRRQVIFRGNICVLFSHFKVKICVKFANSNGIKIIKNRTPSTLILLILSGSGLEVKIHLV